MEFSANAIMKKTHLTGRWFIHDHFLMSPLLGASLNFTIRNSPSLTIETVNNANPLSPSQFFTCRIDNGPWHRWPASDESMTLSFSPVCHQICIMTGGNCDLDDVWNKNEVFTITGMTVDDAATIQPLAKSTRVLVLGDSITAGCWVAGKHASVDYRPESNYLAVAQDFLPQIEIHRVAYSAAGVLRPGTGNVPPAHTWLNQMNAQLAAPTKPFDLVIIALGVNDRRFSTSKFRQAYTEYVKAVRQRYQCQVALMVPFLQSFAQEIKTIGQEMKIPVITTVDWCSETVDGLHPSQSGSLTAGQHFAQALSQLVQ